MEGRRKDLSGAFKSSLVPMSKTILQLLNKKNNKLGGSSKQLSLLTKLEELDSRIHTLRGENASFKSLYMNRKFHRKKKYKPRAKEIVVSETPILIPASLRPSRMPKALSRVNEDTGNQLGPGCYTWDEHERLRGGCFSLTPRFAQDVHEQFRLLMRDKKGKSNQWIIKQNKDLDKFAPEKREALNRERIRENQVRSELHKKTKEISNMHRRQEKLDKSNKEILRLNWRLKKNEFSYLARTWTILISLIGSCEALSIRNNHHQRHLLEK